MSDHVARCSSSCLRRPSRSSRAASRTRRTRPPTAAAPTRSARKGPAANPGDQRSAAGRSSPAERTRGRPLRHARARPVFDHQPTSVGVATRCEVTRGPWHRSRSSHRRSLLALCPLASRRTLRDWAHRAAWRRGRAPRWCDIAPPDLRNTVGLSPSGHTAPRIRCSWERFGCPAGIHSASRSRARTIRRTRVPDFMMPPQNSVSPSAALGQFSSINDGDTVGSGRG